MQSGQRAESVVADPPPNPTLRWCVGPRNACGAIIVAASAHAPPTKHTAGGRRVRVSTAVTETKFGRFMTGNIAAMGGKKVERRQGAFYVGVELIWGPDQPAVRMAA